MTIGPNPLHSGSSLDRLRFRAKWTLLSQVGVPADEGLKFSMAQKNRKNCQFREVPVGEVPVGEQVPIGG